MNHLFRIDCGLTRTTQLYGSFELATDGKRRNLRANTPVGFYDVDGGRQYWQLTNRLGSVMALVDSDGNVQRRSGHYPGGIPFVLDGEDSHVPDPCKPDDRHHIGNRWVSFGGLDWYDNTARMHNPLLMRFTTPDPLASDHLSLSPWSHCAANPANNIDPDGKEVILYGTNLPGGPYLLRWTTHTFIIVKDKDNKISYFAFGPKNNNYLGGSGEGLVRCRYQQDINVYNGVDTEHLKAKIVIPVPVGMDQEEFDQRVIQVAESFGNNPKFKYSPLAKGVAEGNCNSSTSTILSKAGVSIEIIQKIRSRIPGYVRGFSIIQKAWTKQEQEKAIQLEKNEEFSNLIKSE